MNGCRNRVSCWDNGERAVLLPLSSVPNTVGGGLYSFGAAGALTVIRTLRRRISSAGTVSGGSLSTMYSS
ncbi:hypothetical protein BS329_38475 [Amycolatopsis coloradensis]|uniref:Uncharacterized protein n=1 Tax=Amycolatopsis coloradensis TaxID=76021 RepID=A0A1R0KF16_9PSEU|nr:hypothetical protein [Amycolatopsis coloradensis]OLZ43736.1 hypothetical protein BS329_38475 [Amycolatopsis coloradensis]